jgi:hypothetical protein
MYYKTFINFVSSDRQVDLLISKDKHKDFQNINNYNVDLDYFNGNYAIWSFLKEIKLTSNYCCGQIHLHGINTLFLYFRNIENHKNGNENNIPKDSIELLEEFGNICNDLLFDYGQILCTLAIYTDYNNNEIDSTKEFIKYLNKNMKRFGIKCRIIEKIINPNTEKLLCNISIYKTKYNYNGKF